MKMETHEGIILSSTDEKTAQKEFEQRLQSHPLPEDEILANLGLFLTSKALSRVLFFYEIYKKILHVHGIAAEFGVRWGQTLSLLSALRGVFEPFNRHRKIVGFDTFEGFKGVSAKDGARSDCTDGAYNVSENYENYLGRILWLQEQLNPMSHIQRHEIVKGDAVETIPRYFEENPETIVALAIFDFDIYAPTKAALEAIKPRLCKGSVLVFDELCDDYFPGETIALEEVFGINNVRLERFPMTSRLSYCVVE